MGSSCYCVVSGLALPKDSFLVGHPCEVVEIDGERHPQTPYKIAIKEGFRKTDRVLSLHWATADIEDARRSGRRAFGGITELKHVKARTKTNMSGVNLSSAAVTVTQERQLGSREYVSMFAEPTAAIDLFGARRRDGGAATIVGITPRMNFDTFASSFATVFIIWTLTDWSDVMQYLLSEMFMQAMLYFLLMILVGNFFLENLLTGAVIVEFRDREHVRRIIEIRTAENKIKDEMNMLGAEAVQKKLLMTKAEVRTQNQKEFAERKKMLQEEEAMRLKYEKLTLLAALQRRTGEKAVEDISLLSIMKQQMSAKCARARRKINRRGIIVVCAVRVSACSECRERVKEPKRV
jgi:hypothetical protein